MEKNLKCACGASGCNGSSNAFFDLPKEIRSRVEDLLIVSMGRLDLGSVERDTGSEDITVILVSQDSSELSVKLISRSGISHGSDAGAPAKICFYKETVLEQLRPTAPPVKAGEEEEKLPALAEELAHKVESLGYVYSHASRSASLDTVPGFLTTYIHLHFNCDGEQQCQIENSRIELEITYEARRLSKAEAGIEPIGPCGFGC
jgi:hypothetical protein